MASTERVKSCQFSLSCMKTRALCRYRVCPNVMMLSSPNMAPSHTASWRWSRKTLKHKLSLKIVAATLHTPLGSSRTSFHGDHTLLCPKKSCKWVLSPCSGPCSGTLGIPTMGKNTASCLLGTQSPGSSLLSDGIWSSSHR